MQARVSFTQKVKEEISLATFSDEHLRALLAAFIKVNGALTIKNGESQIVVKTESSKVAKFIYSSIERVYGLNCRFSYTKTMNFRKRLTYNVIIDEGDYILGDLEISFLEGKIAKNIVCTDDMLSGYISGAFLASGSCNSPKKSNYHLEFCLRDESFAKWFSKLIIRYKATTFSPKIVERRGKYVVYLKKAQEIVDLLSLMGASNTTLEFESIRIDRDFAAIGNRLQNLDYANYDKTTSSSKKQIKDIKIIDAVLGIDHVLNKKQQLLMKIRLEHDDASMSELATLLSEQLGEKVSRSNINHLFRAIHVLAEQYKEAAKCKQ